MPFPRFARLLNALPRSVLIALAAGTIFRLAAYASDRAYWLDETSLAANLHPAPIIAIFTPLAANQLAPPGFLILGRLLAHTFGPSPFALRLIPLTSGLVALYLFTPLALRLLDQWSASLAIALFACSDELIYFATELKPYSTDVAASVAILLTTLHVRDSPLTPRRWLAWCALGAMAVWLSFTAAFVLVIAGTSVVLPALRNHNWRRAAALAVGPILWLASFAIVIASARAQLGGHPGMWSFWAFAFPPPLLRDPTWIVRRLLFFFVSPGDYHGPLDARLCAVPAIICATLGIISLAKRSRATLFLIAGPLVPAVAAALLHAYPFHGRCILFLLPSLFLLLAEGVTHAARLLPIPRLRVILAALLLVIPLTRDLYHLLEPRARTVFHPLGDRRSANLTPDMFDPRFPR